MPQAIKRFFLILIAVLVLGSVANRVFAQTSTSAVYVPLIGITSVPEPLALPKGGGAVTYHYAVENLLEGGALNGINVTDNKCSPVTLVEGDTNANAKLDYGETWEYTCTTKISTTTESTATATGVANGLTATGVAHATVVVGSNNLPPLVSIVNVTKVAYPLSLTNGGGSVTFIYKVTNPGEVPLSDVTVSDDACSAMSGELGDTNGNGLLDTDEVWTYTCATILTKTITNTAIVTAYADGLGAFDEDAMTVDIALTTSSTSSSSPKLPNGGLDPNTYPTTASSNSIVIVWEILSGILAALIILFVVTRKKQ